MFDNIYRNKKVLVTGFRGFCGSWLSLWLSHLGAKVYGYGHLSTSVPSHYDILIDKSILDVTSTRYELLNYDELEYIVKLIEPDIIFHLAAKAIVARTFKEPRETFQNNVMSAVNVLEVARQCPSVKGVMLVVTDKVYDDKNWKWGYREADTLGGIDPYSASKVCVESVVRCYRESFGINIAVARAGNVIGGGDWSYKRLIPDLVRATVDNTTTVIYTPEATRPWQHILEALRGYLLLGQKILEEKSNDVNRAFNFGPSEAITVRRVMEIAKSVWSEVNWGYTDEITHPHMVYKLRLDCSEAKEILGWTPIWTIRKSVIKTIEWYKDYYRKGLVNSLQDILDYETEVCIHDDSL